MSLALLVGTSAVVWQYSIPAGWSCPEGKFTTIDVNVAVGALTCLNCPAGKFQPHRGAKPCAFCPTGRMAKSNGLTKCANDPDYRAPHRKTYPCPAGRFGGKFLPGKGADPRHCKECPPGRYGGMAGLKTASGCGHCRAGRYGLGGSTTSDCTAACPLGRWCGEGAKDPFDGGVCPKGKYNNGAKESAMSCTLYAPREFRPQDGYRTAYGEMGACVLDKAMRVIEVLHSLHVCTKFDQPVGGACSQTVVRDLVSDMSACCAGNEHAVLGEADELCKEAIEPWIGGMNAKVEPYFRGRLKRQGAKFFRDEYLLIPFFKQGVKAAKKLYDEARDVAPDTDDLTFPATKMLHLCDKKVNLCTSLSTIVSHIEDYYCGFFKCDASKESNDMTEIPVPMKIVHGKVTMTTKGSPLTIAPRHASTKAPTPTPRLRTPSPTPRRALTPVPTPADVDTVTPTPGPTTGPPSPRPHVPKFATCFNTACECRPDYGCNTCQECCSTTISEDRLTTITVDMSGRSSPVKGCMECVAFACPQFFNIVVPTSAPTPRPTTAAPTPSYFRTLDGGNLHHETAAATTRKAKAKVKQYGNLLLGLVTGQNYNKGEQRVANENVPTPAPTPAPTASPTAAPTPEAAHLKDCGGSLVWTTDCPQ